VAIEPGSRLATILGQTTATPMSWHHQCLDRLGEGLRVVSRAPDGVIEAVEIPTHRWLVAVQWHPELTAEADPCQQRLFEALVAVAAERSKPTE
jgi:putative glutamine amidotransferase